MGEGGLFGGGFGGGGGGGGGVGACTALLIQPSCVFTSLDPVLTLFALRAFRSPARAAAAAPKGNVEESE